MFKSLPHVVYNCGKCIFCRKKRASELAMRCVLHASLYKENAFITLTYDEKREDYHNELQYEDIQKFKKRLRKHAQKLKRKLEIFNVHEYGKQGKKHWHLIIFNYDFSTDGREIYTRKNGLPLFTSKALSKLWPYGHHTIADVTVGSAMYQAQYCEKDFKNGNITNDKKSKSNHSGLGKAYFLKHYKQLLKLGYIPFQGTKRPLPRYFEKIAHKHYSHFYEPINFQDTKYRKALYRPFKNSEQLLDMADLYLEYKKQKEEKINKLALDWDTIINNYLQDKELPEFRKSAENYLYDLKQKQTNERF